MHILIGLGLGVVLLYFWLVGHWFARVLVFLLLGGVCGLFGVVLLNAAAPQLGVLGAIGGVVMAWFVAGIPVYCWRWRMKELAALAEAEELRQRSIDIARLCPGMSPTQVREAARRLSTTPPSLGGPPPVKVAPEPPPVVIQSVPPAPSSPPRPAQFVFAPWTPIPLTPWKPKKTGWLW